MVWCSQPIALYGNTSAYVVINELRMCDVKEPHGSIKHVAALILWY